MKLAKLFGVVLLVAGLATPVAAQQAQGQPDRVDQLAEMVGLSADQEKEIRAILDEMQGKIRELQAEARQLQQKLQDQVKANYDEAAIERDAEKLGDVTGKIAALSTLMQAKIDAVFTKEQRAELDQRMQQMQREMQQRRQGQPKQ